MQKCPVTGCPAGGCGRGLPFHGPGPSLPASCCSLLAAIGSWCVFRILALLLGGSSSVQPNDLSCTQGDPAAKKASSNPQVYMDIEIGNKPTGCIQMLLRSDIVPMTAGERDSGQDAGG